nr:MAG TPA: hypothetical protein [Caudoviricetes sp.]
MEADSPFLQHLAPSHISMKKLLFQLMPSY